MDYLTLFSSTTAAVKFRKKLLQQEIPVEILPVPRTLSASCGIAVSFAWPQDPRLLVDETVSKLYRITDSKYELIYESTPPADRQEF